MLQPHTKNLIFLHQNHNKLQLYNICVFVSFLLMELNYHKLNLETCISRINEFCVVEMKQFYNFIILYIIIIIRTNLLNIKCNLMKTYFINVGIVYNYC